MRRGIPVLFLSVAPFLALVTREALADNCSGITSTCINDDTLWPHAGPARFVSVGSAETLAAGQLGFGLVATYLSRPIRLDERSPGITGAGSDQAPAPVGTEQNVINDQANGTFLWSYGVTNRLELDVALPVTFGEGGTGIAPITGGIGLRDTTMRDIRFGFAYALVPRARVAPDTAGAPSFGLVGRFDVSAPTGDSDQFAGEGTAVWAPSLAADFQSGRWFAGVELGARVRPETELLGARVGTQLVTSLGVGYGILPRELLTATLEAWALPTFAEQHTITLHNGELTSTPNGQHIVPAEWQLALRTAPIHGGDLAFQVGGGGPIPLTGEETVPRPQVRFTLGIRWEPLARDSDGDGIPDAVDKCPNEAAPGTADGCRPGGPEGAPTPVVELHISTARDTCASEPDLVAAFGADGCPVVRQPKAEEPAR
jgi:hypothetical protein